MCFVVEVVKVVCQCVGYDFIIIYCLLMFDLVNDGSMLVEVIELVKVIEVVGVIIINIGIGWYEVCILIIVMLVLCGVFSWVICKLKGVVLILLIIINCINDLQVVEDIFVCGDVDMVLMVCLFFVDVEFILKVQDDCVDQINICIGCNQVCFDWIFVGKVIFCLVNLCVCYEILMLVLFVNVFKWLVVVGVGFVGLVFVVNVVVCGYYVMLFDVFLEIGGQFNIVKQIFGKEEFYEMLCYYCIMFDFYGVDLCLNICVMIDDLLVFDEMIFVIGIVLCLLVIDGIDYLKVLSYFDVLCDKVLVGVKVVIIGCGGIGFDIVMFLSQLGVVISQDIGEFCCEWGIDISL